MSNWEFLNKNRIGQSGSQDQHFKSEFHTTSADGFNGLFVFFHNGQRIRVIASDGEGWQHVSVSIWYSSKPPSWEVMCFVKDLFWDDEDWVVQFHPARSEYVNNHPGCLHLWKPTNADFPKPPSVLVGIK